MTATSGRKLSELFVKSGPLGSLAKTLLESSRWFSPARRLKWEAVPLCSEKITEKEYSSGKSTSSKPSAETLSEKVIPSSRLLFQLVPSERPTAGTASGLLPTVQTQGLKRCNVDGKTEFMPLELLPTPAAQDGKNSTIPKIQTKRQQLPGVIGRNCQPSDGQDSPQLNPLFVEEMMGFPSMWTTLPFLSPNGDKNP